MERERKLFVWKGFAPNYSTGLAFAIAYDETEARRLVVAALGYEPSEWGDIEVHPVNFSFGAAVPGGG